MADALVMFNMLQDFGQSQLVLVLSISEYPSPLSNVCCGWLSGGLGETDARVWLQMTAVIGSEEYSS